MSRYSALLLICDSGKIFFGHVDTIMESFSCWHENLSSIVWIPVYTAPNLAQKPVRYQCNQPRSVRAENVAPEVVRFSPFRSHVTLCFFWWWTLHRFLCRFFKRQIQVKPKYWANLVKYIFELSDFRQSVRSVNECELRKQEKKHKKICSKGSDIISNVICASQQFALTFSMQIVKFQRRTTGRRGVICDGKWSENFTADRTADLITVESTMNLTYQTVMRSCYKPVKMFLMLGGNERRPKGDAFGKRRFPSEARSESLFRYWSAVITFGGFPEHWILYYQVYKLIKWRFARFYSMNTKAMRQCVVSTVKFNNNSQITPLHPVDVPVVASPPYFSHHAAKAPRRAYSPANPGLQLRVQFLHHSIRVVCRYVRAAI